jgi:OFA family oxalate/formate antiporter-like MFS transporter
MSAAGAMSPRQRTAAAIAAATVLNLPFGTIYAFSVFLRPMEAMLGIGRAQMSLVFALATISLTVGMNAAPWLYRRLPAVALLLAAGACSAAGLWLTAAADGFTELLLGYGVMFGFGGGVAFILVQQGVNQTMAMPSGLVNGFIVALYPLGAMIGAPVFGWAIEAWGLRQTLAGLGVTVLLAAAAAGWLMRVARIAMHDSSAGGGADADPHWGLFVRLFLVFFLAAAAGLMVMSQAAGIVQAYGGRTALALGATTLITGLIAAARTGGGWLVDRFPVPRVAMGAHLWSLAGVLILTLWPGPLVAIPALAMIGMGYGIVSGLTAGAIAQYWHRNAFGLVAGRLYIAWCVAAISLPVLAGWLFDRTEGYGAAVMIAGAGNVLGMVAAAGLPARRR